MPSMASHGMRPSRFQRRAQYTTTPASTAVEKPCRIQARTLAPLSIRSGPIGWW